jgi:hypothetical protein
MKATIRRLARLEQAALPQADMTSQRLANLIRERRRRRLEAAGEPYYESPRLVPSAGARRLSVAETLRQIRQTRLLAASAGNFS